MRAQRWTDAVTGLEQVVKLEFCDCVCHSASSSCARVTVLLQHRIGDQVMDHSEFRIGAQSTFVERNRFAVRAGFCSNQSEICERRRKFRIELDCFPQRPLSLFIFVELEIRKSECEPQT